MPKKEEATAIPFEKIKDGDLFRLPGFSEVFLKLRYPVDEHEGELGGGSDHYWALRNNGRPAIQFGDGMGIDKIMVIPESWPWRRLEEVLIFHEVNDECRPICKFTDQPPGLWPEGHVAQIYESDGEINCPHCLRWLV